VLHDRGDYRKAAIANTYGGLKVKSKSDREQTCGYLRLSAAKCSEVRCAAFQETPQLRLETDFGQLVALLSGRSFENSFRVALAKGKV